MPIDPKHGSCIRCGGVLEVIAADDATMTVQCQDCDDCTIVEPDAFGDICMKYFLGFHLNAEAE